MKILQVIEPEAFHVSYRVSGKTTSAGTAQERYDALIAELEKLTPVRRFGYFDDDAHTATSSWIVHSAGTSTTLGKKLSRSLTPGTDLLEVIEVLPATLFHLSAARPKPKK